MFEIYSDIDESVKKQAKFWFEIAMCQPEAAQTFRMLKEYRDSCDDPYEREFVDFYFKVRMEEILGRETTNE